MREIKCHKCGNQTEVYDDYKEEYCCTGFQEGCYCHGEPINPVFCDDCEIKLFGKTFKEQLIPNDNKTRNTLQLFRASVESTQISAKKHLNKQSDYGSYHGGVNNTCEAVYAWIDRLEKELENESD